MSAVLLHVLDRDSESTRCCSKRIYCADVSQVCSRKFGKFSSNRYSLTHGVSYSTQLCNHVQDDIPILKTVRRYEVYKDEFSVPSLQLFVNPVESPNTFRSKLNEYNSAL